MKDGTNISSVTPSPLAGKRVLVVEDTWVVAKALQSILEKRGLLVSGPSATVADAERLISEQVPQLAVVDIKLRGEMAFDLIEELYDRGVSVVVCSGFTVTPPAKAAAIVQKPFSEAGLIETLGDVLLRAQKNSPPTDGPERGRSHCGPRSGARASPEVS